MTLDLRALSSADLDRSPGRDAIARVLQALEQHEGSRLHLIHLCAIAEVSERTLRSIFQDAFGIGPNRYLRLRRLHYIRAALATIDPRHGTVADVAARFGCSDGGRMASEYHALFGEYPSTTLRRPVSAKN